MRVKLFASFIAGAVTLAGCATKPTGAPQSGNNMQTERNVFMGLKNFSHFTKTPRHQWRDRADLARNDGAGELG